MDQEQKPKTDGQKTVPATPSPGTVTSQPASPKKRKVVMIVLGLLVVLAAAVFALLQLGKDDTKGANSTMQETATEENVTGALELDPNKNYGDKYADGILPVGDEKYTTDGGKKGTIYMCNDNFVPDQQAGATTRGPWFIGTTEWDVNKKYAVRGEVTWEQKISSKVEGDNRIVVTNGLPDHLTGIFPVAASDPAYTYDRNPNSIKSQDLTYTLSASPTYSSTPKCTGGEVGVMLTGVALFNGFDAGGRDAGAWEIQDGCEGHPQASGIYHYHTLSSCIKDISVSTVIGFALDGFPITGPKVGEKNFLTTDDLDECHGIVSEIMLDGKKTKTYHYVMTQDFPYSASCFRAEAAESPGQHSSGQQNSSGMPPRQGPPAQQ